MSFIQYSVELGAHTDEEAFICYCHRLHKKVFKTVPSVSNESINTVAPLYRQASYLTVKMDITCFRVTGFHPLPAYHSKMITLMPILNLNRTTSASSWIRI